MADEAEIVLSSTTESEEALKHAAGENWREPFAPSEEKPEEKAEAPEGEQPETEPESEPEEPESPEPEQPKGKGKHGFQRRIDKLTRRNYELEERLAEMETRLAGKPAATEPEKPAPSNKPTPESFKTYEEYVEALADWKVREREAAQRQQSQQERIRENVTAYNRRVAEAKGKYEDFEEVISNPEIRIPEVARVPIIEMENGPDVAYFLATHPEELEYLLELNESSEARVIMELGVISRSLQAEKDSPKPKPGTKAAAPIKPVGSAPTKTTVAMDKVDPDEYIRVRRQQIRANRGR